MNVSEKELEGHNDLQQEESAIVNTQHRYAGWRNRDPVFDNLR